MAPVECPACRSTDTRRDADPRRAWQHCNVCGYQWSLLNADFITGRGLDVA